MFLNFVNVKKNQIIRNEFRAEKIHLKSIIFITTTTTTKITIIHLIHENTHRLIEMLFTVHIFTQKRKKRKENKQNYVNELVFHKNEKIFHTHPICIFIR